MPDEGEPAALDTERLATAARAFGIALAPEALAAFERYAQALVAANAHQNLTRITRPEAIAIEHILDSLLCLGLAPGAAVAESGPGQRVVDIGTGAGMPGLAIAIVRPGWPVLLVDRVGKKLDFAAGVAQRLGLAGVTAWHGRAEDLGRLPAHRGRYDLAVARAVAPLPTLAEYLLPLVTLGGRAVVLKGADAPAEVQAAAGAIGRLGGRVLAVEPYQLPGMDLPRHRVELEKVRPTPAAYPRRAGLPAAEPL